jgi:hypothetical protein
MTTMSEKATLIVDGAITMTVGTTTKGGRKVALTMPNGDIVMYYGGAAQRLIHLVECEETARQHAAERAEPETVRGLWRRFIDGVYAVFATGGNERPLDGYKGTHYCVGLDGDLV